ncbi:8-oxo-dGTP pyrophosphatase MutT (NUDIX family) [Bacillus ectoiniformans]|uniref:NUDIX hydrolase n=1 Tax=Bacillus ectoiniformans TaxID=1494429 RepID=UPI001956AF48|nr:CoA pyrophosphatase [Bacillus ectoiniformans]MBM7649167.1 8-oxo-dGTP pyrophosphatase MutT (NUDIX family) [Bacillus ectoiniformans]
MKIGQFLNKFSGRTPRILGSENFAKFSVLLPLIEINGELHVLFEVRSFHMRRQPGEICFPGGKFDPDDKDELHTAIRETAEELGIQPNDVKNIIPLDFMLSPFGTIIYPFTGIISSKKELQLNPDEVAEIFTVPLDYLLAAKPEIHQINFKVEPDEGFPFDLIIGGQDYNWQTRKMDEYFYFYEDKIIWGLTAKILKHFLELLKEHQSEK